MKDSERISLMKTLLSDLTPDQFERGVKTLILRHKEIYPNTNLIAVIREYAVTDPALNSPEEAWGEVVREKSKAFIYSDRKITDPIAEETVKVMGWRNLCLSENEEADRAHFFKIYKSIADRQKHSAIMGGF